MSEEKNKSSRLSRNKKFLIVISICLIASFGSFVGAALITGTSIFGTPTTGPQSHSPTPVPTATPSPTATPVPTATPIPVYSGTIGSVTWVDNANPSVANPASITTGATLTLKAPLTPAPLKSEDVWFYYSNSPIIVDSHGVPTNPDQLAGIDIATVSAGATFAQVSFHVTEDAQWYFIAEIPVPS